MTTNINDKNKNKARPNDIVSSFIRKTYELLEDQRFPEIVDWNSEGTAIVIKKPTEFGQKVLPTYFKHNNLTSFVRQLNMYDFHKRRTQKYDHVYYHDLFQNGKKHLLKEIKRKNQDTTLASIQKAIETLGNIQDGQAPESTTNIYENQLLKKLNKDALTRITSLETKVKDLTIQNQALWNQVNHQNQKEDVLVSFMANFMKKKGITLDQLPKVLNNQFNLPSMDINTETDLQIKNLESFSLSNKLEEFEKPNASANVGDFFNYRDDVSNSTELSPSSHYSKDNQESLDNIESLKSTVLPSLDNHFLSEENDISSTKSGMENWNLESQFIKTFANLDNKVCQSSLGKRGLEDDNQMGDLEKLVKKESYTSTPYFNPFMACGTSSNREEHEDGKIKRLDSFTDMFSNMGNGNLDLMDFS